MVLRACGQAWVGWEALVGDENLLLHSSTLLYSRLHIQEESTVDFTYKKNTLWAKRDEHSDFSTANDRMQPAFAGSYKTVAIPLGSRVTGYLPREHPLVKNGSFGDRFVEGTYLRADHDTPCIRMYCISSGSELLVQDFKSYPNEFPFRDPSCLLRCTPAILKDLAHMHIEDAHDDKLVAEETALHIHTRTQTRAATAATALDDTIIPIASSDDQPERSIFGIAFPRASATILQRQFQNPQLQRQFQNP